MKAIITFIFSLFAMSSFAGNIVTDSIESKVLGEKVKFNVYLPSGFGKKEKKYPVIYLLHGLTDDYTSWNTKGQMRQVVDELIGTGESDEVVIIMPNAGGRDVNKIWNGYFNMPGWPYEDFFFNEFMPTVESKYKAVGDKGHRAIMGLSMGGGGSTSYSQRHTDTFSSCYAMSPWLDNNNSEVNWGDKKNPESKFHHLNKAVTQYSCIKYLENADEETIKKLKTVRWFFDCGDDDFLFDQSVRIHQLMREKKIHSELRIRNGNHNWEYWHQAIRIALPFASRNFSK